jgi:hypothetical protein
MKKVISNKIGNEQIINIEEEEKKLVISRLSLLSPNMMLSLGSEGSFSVDELIDRVREGDRVGEKIVEIQLEWLRSFKEMVEI